MEREVVGVEVLHEERLVVLGVVASVVGFLSMVGLASLHQGEGLAVLGSGHAV